MPAQFMPTTKISSPKVKISVDGNYTGFAVDSDGDIWFFEEGASPLIFGDSSMTGPEALPGHCQETLEDGTFQFEDAASVIARLKDEHNLTFRALSAVTISYNEEDAL